jgi:hypothetical protein
MSWLYLPELVADCSQVDCSAGERSAPLRSTSIASECCCNVSKTDTLSDSQCGTTCEPLTESRGVESWISSLAASRAKTSPSLGVAEESPASEADCGQSTPESLARYDRDSCLWRTAQHSLFGGLEPFSEIWPKAGSMRSGVAYPRPPLERLINGKESGLWPTPLTTPGRPCEGNVRMLRAKVLAGELGEDEASEMLHGKSPFASQGKIPAYEPTPRADGRDNCGGSNARKKAQRHGTYAGRDCNPDHQEWLMGWPIGWTAIEPLATDKFQQWWSAHGTSYPQHPPLSGQ